MQTTRFNVVLNDVVVDATLADADVIQYTEFSSGMIYVPSGSSITSIAWYSSTAADGTFLEVKDGAGNAVTTTIAASQACQIPTTLLGAGYLKAVGNADGVIDIVLKG